MTTLLYLRLGYLMCCWLAVEAVEAQTPAELGLVVVAVLVRLSD
jgi:hypothetical protein